MRPLDDKADMPVHQTKITVTNDRLNQQLKIKVAPQMEFTMDIGALGKGRSEKKENKTQYFYLPKTQKKQGFSMKKKKKKAGFLFEQS